MQGHFLKSFIGSSATSPQATIECLKSEKGIQFSGSAVRQAMQVAGEPLE